MQQLTTMPVATVNESFTDMVVRTTSKINEAITEFVRLVLSGAVENLRVSAETSWQMKVVKIGVPVLAVALLVGIVYKAIQWKRRSSSMQYERL
jgi:hypothetical protein